MQPIAGMLLPRFIMTAFVGNSAAMRRTIYSGAVIVTITSDTDSTSITSSRRMSNGKLFQGVLIFEIPLKNAISVFVSTAFKKLPKTAI